VGRPTLGIQRCAFNTPTYCVAGDSTIQNLCSFCGI
jgi:hypothetical protein